MRCDWRGFYGIIDPEHCRGDVLKTADAILAAGCAVLQLRDKRGMVRDQLALARALKARCVGRGTPFVMNDRPPSSGLTPCSRSLGQFRRMSVR